jgi:hypothetical protein
MNPPPSTGPREGPLFYVWLSTAANASQKKGPGGCSLKRPALTTALLGRHRFPSAVLKITFAELLSCTA